MRVLPVVPALLALATAGGLAFAAPAPAHAEPVAHAPGVDGRWAVTDDGIRLRYEVEGDSTATPIVLLAGGPGASHHAFHLTHARLATLGRVVYLDNRGRGRSDPGRGPRPYTLEHDVADVEAVRRALGAGTIIVYGRSYGGLVAQAYALAHPARVEALVLSNTLDGARAWQEENLEPMHGFLQRQYPERWARILALRARGFVSSDDSLALQFTPLNELYHYDLANDSTYRSRLRDVRETDVAGHSSAVYRAMLGRDPEWTIGGTLAGVEFLPRLGELRMPTLVIAGRYDRICPPSAAARIAAAVPGARLVVFERSGHRPELEEADRWFATMRDFVNEVSARRESTR